MAIPRVLSIAGTDPTGGAGIHADLKSITAAGGYAMGAVTAIVSQNTRGVTGVHYPEVDVLTAQLEAVSDDVEIDAVKIGMLGRIDYIEAVSSWLAANTPKTVVLDPVMVATSGDRLIGQEAESALRQMLPLATLITPNTPELEILAQLPAGSITTADQAVEAAQKLAQEFDITVAVKGGHLKDDTIINHLVAPAGIVATSVSARVHTNSTHGTGCSMSSALATRLAGGEDPSTALGWATRWLQDSLRHADALQVGSGHGPIDHSHRARDLSAHASNQPWLSQTIDCAPLTTSADSTTRAPQYQIPPAGPWTSLLANLSADILDRTMEDEFLTDLRQGTLDPWDFTAYQAQDAHYLNRYARALAALSARASDPQETVFWAASAAGAIEVEQELHRQWLSSATAPELAEAAASAPSPVTTGYTDALLARVFADSYVVGAAAVLPCFWMYAEIGGRLSAHNHQDHPYTAWLSTYEDEEFAQATGRAIEIVENLLEEASPTERQQAIRAYLDACLWEREFFDQARRTR